MSLSFVGFNVSAGSGAANISCSLTALTGGVDTAARTNDLVIFVNSSTNANTTHTVGVVSPTGYTSLGSWYQAGATYGLNMNVSWKVMGATADTAVVGYGSQSTLYESNVCVYVWRNEDTGTQPDVTLTEASGTSSAPNPPLCSPVTSGSQVIAIAAGIGTGSSVTAPTGYTNLKGYAGAIGSVGNTTYFASKAWSGSGSEDPGTFGGSVWTTTWIAATFVIRPAPATLIINETLPNIAIASATESISALCVLPSQVQSGVVYTDGLGHSWTGTLSAGGSGVPIGTILYDVSNGALVEILSNSTGINV